MKPAADPWLWWTWRLFQLGVRLTVTVVACVTVQRLMAHQGYRCDLTDIVMGAFMVVVLVRAWLPWERPDRDN